MTELLFYALVGLVLVLFGFQLGLIVIEIIRCMGHKS